MTVRTIDPQPRIFGELVVYRIVDEDLRYVTLYVPRAASSHDELVRTMNFALDTRTNRLPKEGALDG